MEEESPDFVHELDGRYVHAAGVTSGATDPVPGCEDLGLDVDELWATVDRLAPDVPPQQ